MRWDVNRPFVISVVLALAFGLLFFLPGIKDFLWVHPWWHAFFVAIPTLGVSVAGILVQQRQSTESSEIARKANTLQTERNELEKERNKLLDENNEYTRKIGELHAERNQHLEQIAANTRRELTQAERNADTLRKYFGQWALITTNAAYNPTRGIIAEINEDSVVALFTPTRGGQRASCTYARAEDLDIIERPQLDAALRLTIRHRYGDVVDCGMANTWDDVAKSSAAIGFDKGDVVYNINLIKMGSPERRHISLFSSKDGKNSFLVEGSTGATSAGDNKEASVQFMALQIQYRADGFTHSNSGGSKRAFGYELYVTNL
jgi:hypothetical protein